jgi:hypothetical protein
MSRPSKGRGPSGLPDGAKVTYDVVQKQGQRERGKSKVEVSGTIKAAASVPTKAKRYIRASAFDGPDIVTMSTVVNRIARAGQVAPS